MSTPNFVGHHGHIVALIGVAFVGAIAVSLGPWVLADLCYADQLKMEKIEKYMQRNLNPRYLSNAFIKISLF